MRVPNSGGPAQEERQRGADPPPPRRLVMHAAPVFDPHEVPPALVAPVQQHVAHLAGEGQGPFPLTRPDVQIDATANVRCRLDEAEDLGVPEPERRAQDRREPITSRIAEEGEEADQAPQRRPADAGTFLTTDR